MSLSQCQKDNTIIQGASFLNQFKLKAVFIADIYLNYLVFTPDHAVAGIQCCKSEMAPRKTKKGPIWPFRFIALRGIVTRILLFSVNSVLKSLL